MPTNKVPKYHLQPADLKLHLQTLFPGETIRIKDPDPNGKYFEVKLSRKLTAEELKHIKAHIARDPNAEPDSW
ncbi:unnamed protein product [Discula destructiva]